MTAPAERMASSPVSNCRSCSAKASAIVEVVKSTPIDWMKPSRGNRSDWRYITPGTTNDPVMPFSTPLTAPTTGESHGSQAARTCRDRPAPGRAPHRCTGRSPAGPPAGPRWPWPVSRRRTMSRCRRRAAGSRVRRRIADRWPPTAACQTLVTNEGTIRMAMAALSPSVAVSIASETDGKPRPVTPLTDPARRNASATMIMLSRAGISASLDLPQEGALLGKDEALLLRHAEIRGALGIGLEARPVGLVTRRGWGTRSIRRRYCWCPRAASSSRTTLPPHLGMIVEPALRVCLERVALEGVELIADEDGDRSWRLILLCCVAPSYAAASGSCFGQRPKCAGDRKRCTKPPTSRCARSFRGARNVG